MTGASLTRAIAGATATFSGAAPGLNATAQAVEATRSDFCMVSSWVMVKAAASSPNLQGTNSAFPQELNPKRPPINSRTEESKPLLIVAWFLFGALTFLCVG